MKKQIRILMLAVMLILTSALTLTVNAADATVTLNSDKTQVQAGDTFIVTMNVACEEGINGLQGNVSYDTTKLELVGIAVADTTKWFNLGENSSLAIIHNSSDTETSADIVKVTLKVKDSAEVGTATITISDIVVDSDAASNSMKQVGTKDIQVSIVEEPANPGEKPGGNEGETPQDKTLTAIEITKAPTKNTYKVGDKFDKTGMKVVAKYSDGTSKEITNYTIENGDKLAEGQTSVKVSYTEENITKTVEQKITVVKNITVEDDKKDDDKSDFEDIKEDNTTTDKEMPNTGVSSIIGIMAVIIIFGVFALVRYNKYKGI